MDKGIEKTADLALLAEENEELNPDPRSKMWERPMTRKFIATNFWTEISMVLL